MLKGQPAEEIVAGAAAMIKDGLFTRFKKPDYALSMHDEGTLPSGFVDYHAGYFRVVKGEAQASNAQKELIVDIGRGTDAVYNDPALTKRMAKAVRGAVGKDQVAAVVEMPAKMTSEDFSVYGQNGVKAVLLHVGAVPAEKLAAAKKRHPVARHAFAAMGTGVRADAEGDDCRRNRDPV